MATQIFSAWCSPKIILPVLSVRFQDLLGFAAMVSATRANPGFREQRNNVKCYFLDISSIRSDESKVARWRGQRRLR
jgi:hypothetical protein